MTSQPPTAAETTATETNTEIQISNWKPRIKNTLRGFFTATLPSGMVIHDLMLHEKENRTRWISMPGREYRDEKGERQFTQIIEFIDKEVAYHFRDDILAALDQHFAQEKRTTAGVR